MEQNYGVEMPKKMREDFGYCVKSVSDQKHKELLPDEIYQIFCDKYVNVSEPYKLIEFHLRKEPGGARVGSVYLEVNGERVTYMARGNGRLDAVSNALQKNLGITYSNLTYNEHALEIRAICAGYRLHFNHGRGRQSHLGRGHGHRHYHRLNSSPYQRD